MENKTKIAIMELYKDRGIYIKKLIEKTKFKDNVIIDIFPAYNDEFADLSYDYYIYTGGLIQLTQNKPPHLVKMKEFTKKLSEANKPILGICLGMHVIAEAFGGKVKEKDIEIGFTKIIQLKENLLLKGIPKNFYSFNNHDDYVVEVPEEFDNFASSEKCENSLIIHKNKPIFGIQFHPEYDDIGKDIINFCKEEIIENNLDFNEVLKTIEKRDDKTSIRIMENFLAIPFYSKTL